MSVEEGLGPRRRLLIGVCTLATAAGGFGAGRYLLRPLESVRQPVEFNHKVHVQEGGVECSTCHPYYADSQHSGLPERQTCLECHEEAVGESEAEKRLVELLRSGEPVVFRKLFRMPDHVYYSHRAHVTVAGLKCETCHGDIAATTAPPRVPLVRITMDTCMACHDRSGVQTDCTHCHR